MLHELMAEFGVEPERTLMIGDTTHDLQMARTPAVPAWGWPMAPMRRRLCAPGALACRADGGGAARLAAGQRLMPAP
jgi:3-deoxy-D-manno-octulosonate 8-phosphate phosphatase KdsC-like HAD superfamily phosphatase